MGKVEIPDAELRRHIDENPTMNKSEIARTFYPQYAPATVARKIREMQGKRGSATASSSSQRDSGSASRNEGLMKVPAPPAYDKNAPTYGWTGKQ